MSGALRHSEGGGGGVGGGSSTAEKVGEVRTSFISKNKPKSFLKTTAQY